MSSRGSSERLRLLVVEDGDEYEQFARLFLASNFDIFVARSADAAVRRSTEHGIDLYLLDLRFDRAPISDLTGDVEALARELFSGNRDRALRYVQNEQGALILARLRASGHHQPALFVHDFPERRLHNLRALYGRVDAVPTLDAKRITDVLRRAHAG